MEMTQLQRVQATDSKKINQANDARSSIASQSSGEEGRFEHHLNERVEQTKAVSKEQENKPLQSNKSVENQSDSEASKVVSGEPETVADEAEAAVSNAVEFQLDVETEYQLVSTTITEQGVEQVNDAVETVVFDMEQPLPPDGKSLPPVAQILQTEVTPNSTSSTNAKATPQLNVPIAEPELQQVKVAAASVAAAEQLEGIESEVEFIPPELKVQLKNNQNTTTQVVTAKTSLHIASAAAAASNMQQVPVMTNVSAVNLATTSMPAVDNAAVTTPTLSSTLAIPVQQHNAWSQGVTERVAWMVQGNFQTAESKLNPANLGPLEIKLSIQDDKASVTFITNHAPVREALDAAMPRLRDMLESQGLNLADVNVADAGVQGGQDEGGNTDQSVVRKGFHDSEQAQEAVIQEGVVHMNHVDGVSIYA